MSNVKVEIFQSIGLSQPDIVIYSDFQLEMVNGRVSDTLSLLIHELQTCISLQLDRKFFAFLHLYFKPSNPDPLDVVFKRYSRLN